MEIAKGNNKDLLVWDESKWGEVFPTDSHLCLKWKLGGRMEEKRCELSNGVTIEVESIKNQPVILMVYENRQHTLLKSAKSRILSTFSLF